MLPRVIQVSWCAFMASIFVSASEFAPETLTTLSAHGTNRLLNLENGHAYPSMATNLPVAYLEENPGRGWSLVIENIYNYSTEPERGKKLWQEMTAEQAAEPAGLAAVPFERKGFYSVQPKNFPVTILLPQWGLIQIVGFDERSTNVVLRSKRVVQPGRSSR